MSEQLIKKYAEPELAELLEKGTIKIVNELNEKIVNSKEKLSPISLPMYFTGDLKSDVVMVELNPGGNTDLLKTKNTENQLRLTEFPDHNITISAFKDYLNFYTEFGSLKLDLLKKEGKGLQRFDKKQIDFFTGLDLLEVNSNSGYTESDMLKVRNQKLQLEIVPYHSNSFSFKNFTEEYINECFERVFTIINSHPRKHIFMVGSNKEIKHLFKKLNVKPTFQKFSITGKTRLVQGGFVEYNGNQITLIPSYKNQSLWGEHVRQYGKHIRKMMDSNNR